MTTPYDPQAEAEAAKVSEAGRAETAASGDARRAEKSMMSASQRRVNLIWETTQSFVAVIVVTTTCIGVVVFRWLAMQSQQPPSEFQKFPSEWWTIVGLVIGFYFGRTNHTRTGGVTSADVDDRIR